MACPMQNGFFDAEAARAFHKARKLALIGGRTGQIANVGDSVSGAMKKHRGETVASLTCNLGLVPQAAHGFGGRTGQQTIDGLDQTHEDSLKSVDLVLEQPKLIDHSQSLPADVGAEQGRARAGMAEDDSASSRSEAPKLPHPPTWSTPMRKLLAACRRLDDHWVGDVIGVVFLFGLIPLVLFIGYFLNGGH